MIRPLTLDEIHHPLTRHLAPVFAFGNGQSVIAGSAALIAPGFAITAKHVLDEILSKFGLPQGSNIELDLYLFQLSGECWFANFSSSWIGCDLTLLSLSPRNEQARATQLSHLGMTVDPPSAGKTVTALGFPESQFDVPRNDSEITELKLTLIPTASEGPVLDVYYSARDSIFARFPCFSVETEFTGGMSGGPVLDEDRNVCGIVCIGGTGALAGTSIASSVWTIGMLKGRAPTFLPPLGGLVPGETYGVIELAKAGYFTLHGLNRLLFFTHDNGSAGIRRVHPGHDPLDYNYPTEHPLASSSGKLHNN